MHISLALCCRNLNAFGGSFTEIMYFNLFTRTRARLGIFTFDANDMPERERISYSVVLHNINPFRITCFICAHNYRVQFEALAFLLRVPGLVCVRVCGSVYVFVASFYTLLVHII